MQREKPGATAGPIGAPPLAKVGCSRGERNAPLRSPLRIVFEGVLKPVRGETDPGRCDGASKGASGASAPPEPKARPELSSAVCHRPEQREP
jgi:hypothetical protein